MEQIIDAITIRTRINDANTDRCATVEYEDELAVEWSDIGHKPGKVVDESRGIQFL